MKRFEGIKKALPVYTVKELERMTTPKLLARFKRLKFSEETCPPGKYTDEQLTKVQHKIMFKDTDVWAEAYADVKAILDARWEADNPGVPSPNN